MTMFKWIEFIVSTANWHLHRYLPSTYSRIKSCAALVADFQHFLKGVQGGGQKRHSVFGGHGAGRTDLQIVLYFQELVLWARFLYLLKFRKALNPSCWWLLLVTSRNLLQKKKKNAWFHVPPLHQNHIYTNHPQLPLWSSFSQLSEVLSWVVVLILTQIKLNMALRLCNF